LLDAGFSELGADDLIASWEFSDALDSNLPYRSVVPSGRFSENRAALSAEIRALRASAKRCALNNAVFDAVQDLAAQHDSSRINAVVVVTNGSSTATGDLDLDSLLRDLQSASESADVHVFTVAYGAHPNTSNLSLIARASRGASYDVNNPASVVTGLLSNF
jgi:Ca-activated chloride channel family protein